MGYESFTQGNSTQSWGQETREERALESIEDAGKARPKSCGERAGTLEELTEVPWGSGKRHAPLTSRP